MQVYIRNTASTLEREVAHQLDRLDQIEGCALVGFDYGGSQVKKEQKEIDAVFLSPSGVACCLEVKGREGIWRGSKNSAWSANGKPIDSSSQLNPYLQAQGYAFRLKDLCKRLMGSANGPWVNAIVVAPDQTQIEICDAHVNRMGWGRAINICQFSKLGQVLSGLIEARRDHPQLRLFKDRLDQLGFQSAVAQLVDLSEQELLELRYDRAPKLRQPQGIPQPQPEPLTPVAIPQPVPASIPQPIPHSTPKPRRRVRWLWPAAAAILMGAIGLGGSLKLQGSSLAGGTSFDVDPLPPTQQSSSTPTLSGVINGWSMITADQAQLSLNGDDGRIYSLYIDLEVMRQIPSCTSPGSCNHRRVQIASMATASQRLEIATPEQMIVL